MENRILLKRIYEPPEESDGYRILVNRLWPRGIKKEAAHLDEWAKVITPSTEIRRLYHQGEMPFDGFAEAYQEELAAGEGAAAFAAPSPRAVSGAECDLGVCGEKRAGKSCAGAAGVAAAEYVRMGGLTSQILTCQAARCIFTEG